LSSFSIYRENQKEEKEMEQVNTIQCLEFNPIDNSDLELDTLPNEDDIICEHEPIRKIGVLIGLEACTYQYMMK
jgi:hypothetical protein